MAFFDKLTRARSYLTVGPITLTQAPMGYDHPSSVPTVGEILVGVLVPNTRKSFHLTHVLRGWSTDAKPLQELHRMLKYGTKKSEFQVRELLLQPAGILSRSPESIRMYRDDIYMIARIILWGNMRPLQVWANVEDEKKYKLDVEPTEAELLAASNLRISMSAMDFIETLSIKLNSDSLIDAFKKGLTIVEAPVEQPGQKKTLMSTHQAMHPSSPVYSSMILDAVPESPKCGTPLYGGTSPPYYPDNIGAGAGPSESTVVTGTGPVQTGAIAENTNVYVPSSPTYAPSSPTYAPSSPTY
jgi:hypothetical protein